MTMALLFWICVAGVLYPYAGYPLALWAIGRVTRRPAPAAAAVPPAVTMIVPVHNEESRMARKMANTLALDFPADRLQVVFVSDGSTDRTVDVIRASATPSMEVVELPHRGGKAAALNAGLARARNEILVFSDASIELEPPSLRHIVSRFADPAIGCISGEDRIAGSGGEAWYGRYELLLRRLESDVHSIVGASGSFYAQRRALCRPFTEGMAPDFLSVLRTVEQGARAVTAPAAVGAMTSAKDHRNEFERKTRTAIRGITTLVAYGHMLNPFRYGLFAFALLSHKVLRWLAPLFLIGMLLAAVPLAGQPFYAAALAAQAAFYLWAAAAHLWPAARAPLPGRIALYFTTVNMAILVAWVKYASGVRQELWTPTAR